MKALRKLLTIILGLIVLAAIGGLIYLNNLKVRAVPDYGAAYDLESLTEKVTVYRDSMGIPHIYAQNEADLYRVVGYVMAQDRLWQMDLLRRITTGRLSEVLDPELVNADMLFRSLRFSEKSKHILEVGDPHMIECVKAYSDGINQYIEDNKKRLPFEFAMLGYKPEPWEPIHTVNLIGYMAWDLASGWDEDITLFNIQNKVDSALFMELLPDMNYHNVYVHPDFENGNTGIELQTCIDEARSIVDRLGLQVLQASNNWAVSGTRSESGMPLMSNDMHQGLMAPGIWYQMHQVVEGGLNVTGVSLPGTPYIICGHNEDIAWGMTNVYVDDIDFYMETVNPADSMQYKLDGKWETMKVVEEKVMIKGQDEPEIRFNRFTHRGPVVTNYRDLGDRIVSVRWQGNESSNEIWTIHQLNRASNWQEFRTAISTFTSISQNIIYADRHGNIGLQTAAGIPIREEGGTLIYPGDTSLYDWKGTVPFEDLPYTLNPDCGYVSSANNRSVGDDYPYYVGTRYGLPNRIIRIREMLDGQSKHGIEDFQLMLRDQNSYFARKLTPVYLEALKGKTEGAYSSAFQILVNWDYEMDADLPAPLIFEVMWVELTRAMLMDELGETLFEKLLKSYVLPRYLINEVSETGTSLWCDDISTAGISESFSDNIVTAFHSAVDSISSKFGDESSSWKWGDQHKVALIHPMGSVAIVDKLFKVNSELHPVGGSFHTVCPYAYPLASSLQSDYVANHAASQRHIYSTADWDRSLTVIPTGNSGVPASPYYLNQTELYVNNQFHGDHFSKEAVLANKKHEAVFE